MMGHDDLFNDSQAQSGAINSAGKKRFKNLVAVFLFNTCAVIANTQDDFPLTFGKIQFFRFYLDNFRTLGTEGQGVIEQMTENSEDLALVSPE
jgi:hypothetical protein